MALETLQSSPVPADYTLLSAHQEQTPGSFFGGKPVLHLHSPGASIRISREDLESQPALSDLREDNATTDDGIVVIGNIDVWVGSSHLNLFSPSKAIGVQIPYPTITIHAQEGNAVLLGLNLSDSNTPDEDLVFIQLRIIPTSAETYAEPSNGDAPSQPNGHADHSSEPSRALFKAISDCQELNPDPPEEGDEIDETAPGATGWITSENMQDFMDENGELRIPEGTTVLDDEQEGGAEDRGLGEGAGRTRTAAEMDAEDGAEEETKWQRTD